MEHEESPVEKSLPSMKEMNTANILSTPSSEEDGSESCDKGSANRLLDIIYIDTNVPNLYMLTLNITFFEESSFEIIKPLYLPYSPMLLHLYSDLSK